MQQPRLLRFLFHAGAVVSALIVLFWVGILYGPRAPAYAAPILLLAICLCLSGAARLRPIGHLLMGLLILVCFSRFYWSFTGIGARHLARLDGIPAGNALLAGSAFTARNLREIGIPYIYSFCPNVSEKPHPTPGEQRIVDGTAQVFARVTERRAGSARIIREEGQIDYDAMALFRSSEGEIFTDQCHLNREGVNLVARDMTKRLFEWIERPVE